MTKLATNKLTPGMVLAQPIVDGKGALVIPEGARLTQQAVAAIAKLRIAEVDIDPVSLLPHADPLRRSEAYVRKFFQYADPDNEAIIALYHLTVERTAAALEGGWKMPSEDVRLVRNMEHLNDVFPAGEDSAHVLVDHETQLASFPDVYLRIKKVLDDPGSTAEHIAEVVSADMGLSARLLKLVNSPLYGFPARVDNIARAVSMVGAKELTMLALGISTINFFKDIPPELIDMQTFWRHSISCGIIGKLLAKEVKGLQADRFFTAGLLYDVGLLILFKKQPYASIQALMYARTNTVPLVEAELETFGYDHTEITSTLLSEWNFPQPLVDIITWHHNPAGAPNPQEAAIIHIADNITNAVEISSGGMYVLPGIEEGAWELLGISPEKLGPVIEQYDADIEELLGAFL